MANSITLDSDAARLVHEIARVTGKSPEAVVRDAVHDAAKHHGIVGDKPRKLSRDERVARLKQISDRSAARPVLDPRSPDEIIGYDEFGLPR